MSTRRIPLAGAVALGLLGFFGSAGLITTGAAAQPASVPVASATIGGQSGVLTQVRSVKGFQHPGNGRAAASRVRRQTAAMRRALTAAGIFTVNCRYSHSATDDPIVHPDMPGMSHLHDFFGNTSTNSGSTIQSLLAGSTTCSDQADTSAYWTPAVQVDGEAVAPVAVTVYYRGARNRTVTPVPAGFKLVAPHGNPSTRWSCNFAGVRFKQSAGAADVPSCDGETRLVAHVRFPSCWDGRLDSPDHMSHVVYPGVRRACPAGHATRIPELVLNVRYPLSVRGGAGLRLASGDASSMHADVFAAWQGQRQAHLIAACLNRHRRCGPARFIQ